MKVLVAGDFCPRDRVATFFEKGDFSSILGDVRGVVSQADYSIVNFECPVTKGSERPIEKVGPNLQCSEKGIEAVKWAGFNCVTLANNHIYDFGDEGVKYTLEICKKYGVDTVGGGINILQSSKILYKTIGNQTLAIINCCEHEFSIATESTCGSNPLKPIQQYYAIQEAKSIADYVLVIVHGGHEHWQLPSPRMVETYRFFVDAGADAVVNHHQHCYSGYEYYKEKPILYGLGNFCFDSKNIHEGKWTEGYMVELNFSANVTFLIHPYIQCAKQPQIILLHQAFFDNKIRELNSIIQNSEKLIYETEKYYSQSVLPLTEIFEPFDNRWYNGARHRDLIPSLITKKRFLKASNYILCEAHRDKLMWWLGGEHQTRLN